MNESPVHTETVVHLPTYLYEFRFEKEFNYKNARHFMEENLHLPFYLALIYLLLIFYGQIYMSSREKPFKLKLPLAIWNILLALFSIWGTLRVLTEMFHVLTNFGFHHSACSNTFIYKVSTKQTIILIDKILVHHF